jgi:pimeloyl-ACP methyl ester carboxylesterase
MSNITVQDLPHYYELQGEGPPLVFVHGAFVDGHMWDPQFDFFSKSFKVLRYDLRGHGRTGPSTLEKYAIETFAYDLAVLLEELQLENPIVCGLSLGGMIAQSFAVKYPERLRALILSDTAVSVSLTWMDKLQRYVLFPKWLMLVTIRLMSAEAFTRFSFWMASVTRYEGWIGRDEATRTYVESTMVKIPTEEYLKVYDAIYDFGLLPLERITCPTLVLKGEFESKSVFRHTEEILRRVPQAQEYVISGAGHTSNMENPIEFNRIVDSFLDTLES